MAQLIAMRIHSDDVYGCKLIALHPSSHLLHHEYDAFEHVWRMRHIRVGDPNRVLTAADVRQALANFRYDCAVMILELPQRYNGGACVAWEDVVAISRWCRERGIRLHLDGARLWEAQAYYQRDWPEICSLFDSVYVCFYKGLGAMAGAMLLGNHSFIQRARIWQRRMGGNVYTSLPYEISARWALESNLMTFAARTNKMRSTIMQMNRYFVVTGWPIRFDPPSPHTCMVHVYLRGKRQFLELARDQVLEVSRIQLFHTLKKVPRWKLATELEEAPPPPDDVLRDVAPSSAHPGAVPYFSSRSNLQPLGSFPPPTPPSAPYVLEGGVPAGPGGAPLPQPPAQAAAAAAGGPGAAAPAAAAAPGGVVDVGGVGVPPPGLTLDLTGQGVSAAPPAVPPPVDAARGGGGAPPPSMPPHSSAAGPAGVAPAAGGTAPAAAAAAPGGGELVGMLPNAHMHAGAPSGPYGAPPPAAGGRGGDALSTSGRAGAEYAVSGRGAAGGSGAGHAPVVPVASEFYFEWSIGPSNIQLHENWYIYGWQQFWKYYTDIIRADSRPGGAPAAQPPQPKAPAPGGLGEGAALPQGAPAAAGEGGAPGAGQGGAPPPGAPGGGTAPAAAPPAHSTSSEDAKVIAIAKSGARLTRSQRTQLERIQRERGQTLEELIAGEGEEGEEAEEAEGGRGGRRGRKRPLSGAKGTSASKAPRA